MGIPVVVCGAGRMGSTVIDGLLRDSRFRLAGVVEREGYTGEGVWRSKVPLITSSKFSEFLISWKGAVVVDFTNPEASMENAEVAVSRGCNLVIGTTGLNKEQKGKLSTLIKEANLSAVVSPNFSIGVNIFWMICEKVARYMPDADIEIIELHHRGKKDAPSGTALHAGEIISRVSGIDTFTFGRKGEKPRGREIGIHSIRSGDIVGEHTVLFGCDGERIEITHRAHSRVAFVRGCLRAIEWVYNRRDGVVHNFSDVLGVC